MRIVYSPRYHLDFGFHVFPTAKYRLVADAVADAGLAPQGFVEPVAATWDELALVHTPAYLTALREGRLSPAEIARLEIPCDPSIVDGFRFMTGGTLTAVECALDGADRVAVHIGGGFHHAFAGHGEGFCMFNDIAVGVRRAIGRRQIGLAAVIDVDVHQGNGTAAIFRDDPTVFTLSLHGAKNFPFRKTASDLDVELPDGCADAAYLRALDDALDSAWQRQQAAPPGLAFYLAGADPHESDRLGRLKLSLQGLAERDRRVFARLAALRVPAAVVMAGGYNRDIETTVAIHRRTLELAQAHWLAWRSAAGG